MTGSPEQPPITQHTAGEPLFVVELPYRSGLDYFEHISHLPNPVLLDSGQPGAQQGRFDIVSAAPLYTLTFTNGQMQQTWTNGAQQQQALTGNKLTEFLNSELAKHRQNIGSSISSWPFCGGFIGYFAYDLGRSYEQLPKYCDNDIGLADLQLGFYPWACITDHEKQHSHFVCLPEAAGLDQSRRRELLDLLGKKNTSNKEKYRENFKLINNLKSTLDVDSYKKSIAKIHDYIVAGDCYQVNFTQRFSAGYEGSPWQAYKTLRQSMPAPFGAYLQWQSGSDAEPSAILSFSPERFLELRQGEVMTQPIKGTAPRSDNPAIDQANADALLASEKNRAENLMIVDLLRNDLGRCCETGSVSAETLFELQSFSNVHHLVSTVRGTLRKGLGPFDLLAATLPGGSITGAPKIRAMQVIEELEPRRRSIYCGAVGYININGDMDTNIAIRTVLCHNNQVHCWGGGGIVADSQWEHEYQESLDKIGLLLKGLEATKHL